MRKKIILTTIVALTTFVIGGCAGTSFGSNKDATGSRTGAIESQAEELARREAAIVREEARLEAERQKLEDERNAMQLASETAQKNAADDSSTLTPPDAEPGTCYARVKIPAKYEAIAERKQIRDESYKIDIERARFEQVRETVLKKEASSKLVVVPAEYETVTERVMVEPESRTLTVVPAVYETVTEQVLVKPAYAKLEVVPAEYETVTEPFMVRPPGREWKSAADIGAASVEVLETRLADTGELMCLVETRAEYENVPVTKLVRAETTREVAVPAEYETVTKRVLKTPATTIENTIPAKYEDLTVTRLVSKETTREEVIPAEYHEVLVTKLVEPTKELRSTIPAEYTQLKRTKLVSKASFKWERVLCKLNMTRDDVRALQQSLNDANSGGRACEVDGFLGPCTLKSAERYAKSKGLPYGDTYVRFEVADALGLEFEPD